MSGGSDGVRGPGGEAPGGSREVAEEVPGGGSWGVPAGPKGVSRGPGRSWGCLGVSWGVWAASGRRLGGILGCLGAVLEPGWGDLGGSRGRLGGFWGSRGGLGAVWGGSRAGSERSRQKLRRVRATMLILDNPPTFWADILRPGGGPGRVPRGSWRLPGASWEPPGASWEFPGVTWGVFGAS